VAHPAKAFAARPDARWNMASISVGDGGKPELHFWHASDWKTEPNVVVNAQTGAARVDQAG
jgi:hypothetical protein